MGMKNLEAATFGCLCFFSCSNYLKQKQMFNNTMDVSKNSGTPKSSILIGFSTISIHFGVPLFLETPTWNPGGWLLPRVICARTSSKIWFLGIHLNESGNLNNPWVKLDLCTPRKWTNVPWKGGLFERKLHPPNHQFSGNIRLFSEGI